MLLLSGTALDAGHTVGEDQYEPGKPLDEQAHSHRVNLTLANLNLNVRLGLTSRFGISVFVPARTVRVEAAFHDENDQEIPNYESIHHRTETLTGLGDVRLSGHWRALEGRGVGAWILDLRLGFSLPTGSTEDDPFVLGASGHVHQHIFFGTGTVDPAFGLEASRAIGAWRVQTFARAQLPLYSNSYGYRGPRLVAAGFGLSRGLGTSGVRVMAQASTYHEFAATWSGKPANNSGRTDAVGSLGVTYRLTESIGLLAMLRVPKVLRAQGGQLALAPTGVLGVTMGGQAWKP